MFHKHDSTWYLVPSEFDMPSILEACSKCGREFREWVSYDRNASTDNKGK